MVVVILPSTLMIQVWIPLATEFSVLYLEKTKIDEKVAGIGPFKKIEAIHT